jgi:predicted transcriptional regulator
MITRTVKLPNELDARLRRRARTQKLTYSEAARRALQEGLREDSGVNMLAALAEFAGSVEGPEDLSTNKAYLDDYGAGSKSR